MPCVARRGILVRLVGCGSPWTQARNKFHAFFMLENQRYDHARSPTYRTHHQSRTQTARTQRGVVGLANRIYEAKHLSPSWTWFYLHRLVAENQRLAWFWFLQVLHRIPQGKPIVKEYLTNCQSVFDNLTRWHSIIHHIFALYKPSKLAAQQFCWKPTS